MRVRPLQFLVITSGLVIASTAVLAVVTGHGTTLHQVLALGAWSVVASLFSSAFADQHHAAVWLVAVLLSLVLYCLPASAICAVTYKRAPRFGAFLLHAWCFLYIAALFVLLPAGDGP